MSDKLLYVLAQAGYAGEMEYALMPARVADPLLRPVLKSSVRSAIKRAEAATKEQKSDHVLRLAFLLEAKKVPEGTSNDDVGAIQAAFAEHAKPYEAVRKTSWSMTPLLVVAGLAAGGTVAYLQLKPTANESFMSSPFAIAVAQPLTDFVGAKKHEDGKKILLSDPVKDQLGDTWPLWRDTIEGPAKLYESGANFPEVAKAVQKTTSDLNDALAKKKLPVYVSLQPKEASKSHTFIAFEVVDRATAKIGDKSLRIVEGYRMDDVDDGWQLVAQSEGSDWVRVNLSLYSHYWLDLIAPSVYRGKPISTVPTSGEGPKLDKALSAAFKGEINQCIGLDDKALDALSVAVEERRPRFETIAKKFKAYDDAPRNKPIFLTPAVRADMTKALKDEATPLLEWEDKVRAKVTDYSKVLVEFARADEHAWIYAHQNLETPPPPPKGDEGQDRPKRPMLAPKYNDLAGWLAFLASKPKCYRLGLSYVILLATKPHEGGTKTVAELQQDFPDFPADWVFDKGLTLIDGPGGLDLAVYLVLGELGLDTNPLVGATALLKKTDEEIQAAAQKAYEKRFGHAPTAYARTSD
ncbi:MAG: hypothetical protein U0414_26990 [Polyangiaceae bacterium]